MLLDYFLKVLYYIDVPNIVILLALVFKEADNMDIWVNKKSFYCLSYLIYIWMSYLTIAFKSSSLKSKWFTLYVCNIKFWNLKCNRNKLWYKQQWMEIKISLFCLKIVQQRCKENFLPNKIIKTKESNQHFAIMLMLLTMMAIYNP